MEFGEFSGSIDYKIKFNSLLHEFDIDDIPSLRLVYNDLHHSIESIHDEWSLCGYFSKTVIWSPDVNIRNLSDEWILVQGLYNTIRDNVVAVGVERS